MRSGLQLAVAVAGLVPAGAGLAGLVLGPAMVGGAAVTAATSLDSHFRYLSGLLLGIGLVFWSLIPDISRQTRTFRVLTFVVFVGGLGRLVALLETGWPEPPMLFGLAMELVVTPLLCLWQSAIAVRERG